MKTEKIKKMTGANDMKDLIHTLNSKLTIMSTNVQTLLDKNLDKEIKECMNTITGCIDEIANIINLFKRPK